MSIEINTFFGDIFNSIYSATGLNKILRNVLYTSLFLSIIILVVTVTIYPCKKNTPMWIIFKLYIYILIISTIIISIHNNFIKSDFKEKYLNENVNHLMNNIHGANYDQKDKVEVIPDFKNGGGDGSKPKNKTDDGGDNDGGDNDSDSDEEEENKIFITAGQLLNQLEKKT